MRQTSESAIRWATGGIFPVHTGRRSGVEISGDVVDAAAGCGFHTFVASLQQCGLLRTLKRGGPYTLLAPTDEAFTRLPSGRLAHMFSRDGLAELTEVMRYHVLPGRMSTRQISTIDAAPTMLGPEVAISAQVSTVQVNQALVTRPDIKASNGVVHAIDDLLMPPKIY